MIRVYVATLMVVGISLGAGCKRDTGEDRQGTTATKENEVGQSAADPSDHGHEHAEGDDHDQADHVAEKDHAHDEVDLGAVTIGDMTVSLAQGHGKVEPGKEGHLIVKLPYSDQGATVVRAWIGTEDRTASYVGKGEYAPSHDDYDIHAIAPDPLPENLMWWIEIEKPDGTKLVGSAKPILD